MCAFLMWRSLNEGVAAGGIAIGDSDRVCRLPTAAAQVVRACPSGP